MLTYFHFVVVASFATPIVVALAAAKLGDAAFRAHAFLLTVGLTVGFAFAWALEATTRTVTARMMQKFGALPGWFSYGLFLTALGWIVIAGLFVAWLSLAILRLIS